MPLTSQLFRNDQKLNACANVDSAHVTQGAVGDHVAKIQIALQRADSAPIDGGDLSAKRYGSSTASAVLRYKTKRAIINRAYQTQPDSIVGKMTIVRLDQDMVDWERNHREESEDELSAELDQIALRLCAYGAVCDGLRIRRIKAELVGPQSDDCDGATLAETAAALVLLAIFALILMAVWTQRKGMAEEANRIRREINDHIARFSRMMVILTLQGGTRALMTIQEIRRAVNRAINDYETDIAECEQHAKLANDPNQLKVLLEDCQDEKLNLKRVLREFEQFFQKLKSPNRTLQWDATAEQQFDQLCQKLFTAMFNFKTCMKCP